MVGGLLMRRWTSRAPASRTMPTILREVVPRTIESSMSTTRCPSRTSRTGFSLIFTPKERMDWLGLDERPAHVVVADEAPLEGQPALLRVAEGGAHPAVGHGHHHVGGGGGLAGELAAEGEA